MVSVAAFGLVTFSFLSVFLIIFLASSAAFAPVNFSFVSACCELTSLSVSFFSGSSALGLDFSYPFAGGEFKGGASDILSESPEALLGYSYKKGDPESTDPYLEFKANWDPIEGDKSAFFGLKKKTKIIKMDLNCTVL